jgi:hypothetical protein
VADRLEGLAAEGRPVVAAGAAELDEAAEAGELLGAQRGCLSAQERVEGPGRH